MSAALAAQQLEHQRKAAALQEVAGQLSGTLSDSLSSLAAAQGEARELQAGLVAVKRQNIGWQRHCRGLALRLRQSQAQLSQVTSHILASLYDYHSHLCQRQPILSCLSVPCNHL